MSNELKVRYNDEDLQEFKILIDKKIENAQEELNFTVQQIKELNESGFKQQGGDWFDDTSSHTDLEMQQRLMARQQKHLQDLKNALHRIANKTYGVCIVTGQLIDKQRLKAVPHATKTVDGKNMTAAPQVISPDMIGHSDPLGLPTEEVKSPGKSATSDKVRMPNIKKSRSNDDEWESESDAGADSGGYTPRAKEDDDED
jgi:DnaK suppressor protein